MHGKFIPLAYFLVLIGFGASVSASSVDDEVLATRGDGVVTQEQFKARAFRIPEEHRFSVIRDRSRLEDLLNALLRDSQLAADAREAGLDNDPIVQARMRLAAQKELAEAWISHYVESAPDADYEALAREQWMLTKDNYRSSETIDVTHLLVNLDERTSQEALARITEIREKLMQDPGQFETMIMEYSDDKSKSSNRGTFTGVKRGDTVGNFEDAAFSLPLGEISEPIRTQFGYHLIRVDNKVASQPRTFDDVKVRLELDAKKSYLNRVRDNYLQELNAQPVEVTPEALETMVENVFGREVMAKYAEENESR